MMCEVLGVSPSGYYAWKHRPPSARAVDNDRLLRRMREIHLFSRETYGQPRMQAELRDDGWRVNHKRVRRLMRLAGLQGATRRKKWRTTKRDRHARPAPDLIERDFSVEGPDQLWVADITYVPTSSGFLYLAVVVDAWSRRVVGWSMKTHLKTDLVLDALNMALQQRRPGNDRPTASAADRAVLVELRRFLAVIHSTGTLPRRPISARTCSSADGGSWRTGRPPVHRPAKFTKVL